MSEAAAGYQLFVGVDIAATSFAASWMLARGVRERAVTFAQTPEGFAAFQERLMTLGVIPADTLVVLEATGSYWVALAVSVHTAGFAVSGNRSRGC